ncbi:dihydroxyacetone kinase family protein [Kocuria sp.]|uniref:dihydroxyacetone kinase family protein n=1 Tax=Kocuria sp. TaxID=1871328 RepID=UPI0026DBBEE3|nr:dihydroxyacetone kinase family protein [Kocuria sp.]MDO4919367.1 dihydroxyacetone kinase family protein [Kocuria sp.]
MTTLYDAPEDFADDQLEGFLQLYADRLRGVPGGVVALPQGEPTVAVVVGGGSGHYPAFAGLVGPGFASGAVVGNIFTSPSAAHVYSVAKAAHRGRGVVLTFGKYAGDVMNFGIAAERLNAEGIDTRIVHVTDDVASAEDPSQRRGIAGDFVVFKAMGAAAARGDSLDEVERIGRAVNEHTRTMGVAFSGCTMPGADSPLFTVPEGHLGLGLGIHGEPGIRDVAMPRARELADMLVEPLLADAAAETSRRVGVIVNGLGTTKYEELFLLFRHVSGLLAEAGYSLVEPEVGELVTSLDMGGCSVTLVWLDDESEPLWRADAYTPAYRKHSAALTGIDPAAAAALEDGGENEDVPVYGEASAALAEKVRAAVVAVAELIAREETTLGEIDAVAGDGDHGRGMRKGTTAAWDAVESLAGRAGASFALRRAGQQWAERAGGTSGVLWGAALEAASRTLDDSATDYDDASLRRGVVAFTETIQELGGAQKGDKTMLDALLPFVERLTRDDSEPVGRAWAEAAATAVAAARDTAQLRPRVGRARPLAEKSLGHPDAGATSMGMILQELTGLVAGGQNETNGK